MVRVVNHALLRTAYLLILSGVAIWFAESLRPVSMIASAVLAITGLLFSTRHICPRFTIEQYAWGQAVVVTTSILAFGSNDSSANNFQFLITAFSIVAMAAFASRHAWIPLSGYVVYSTTLLFDTFVSAPVNLGYQLDYAMRGVVLGGFVLLVVTLLKQRIDVRLGEQKTLQSLGRALLLCSIFPALMLPLQLSLEDTMSAIIPDTMMGFLLMSGLGLLFYRRKTLSDSARWGITLFYGIGFVVSLSNVGGLALPVVFLTIPIAFALVGRVYAIGISLAVVMLPLSLSQLSLFDLSSDRAFQALFAGFVIVGLFVYLAERDKTLDQLMPSSLLAQKLFWVRYGQINALCYVLFVVAMAPLLEEVYVSQRSQFAETLLLPTVVGLVLFQFLGFFAGRSAVEREAMLDAQERQKQSINDLQSAQQQLDRVASNANIVFLRIDLKTDLITSNRLWRERWDFSEGQQISFAHFKTMMSPKVEKIFADHIDKVTKSKTACEVTFESKLKGPNWARLYFSPELDQCGEVVGIEITNVDITKEVQAKQELAAANTELSQTLERQREMFAVIGHELRTPVASIDMLLQDEETTSDQKLDMISEITRGLLGVLDDLRVVVSPERVLKVSNEAVSPRKLIMRTLGPMTGLLEKGGLKLNLDLEESAEQCEFNAQALRRLVNNLVKNAVVHAQASNIWIQLRRSPEESYSQTYRLTVEDDGIGVSEAFEEHLFSAFSRGNTKADGTGLGLHICRELAGLLNGTIKYAASPRGGAAFIVEFTLDLAIPKKRLKQSSDMAENPATKGAIAVAQRSVGSMKGLKVLVAEDEQLLRILTAKQLSKMGAEVVACEDGSAALKAFRSADFDLVLTDIMMPVMDGYGLTRALRQEGYQGPIFGVTAAVVGDETQRLLDAGANLVLEKPLRSARLEQACADFESLKPSAPRVIVVDDDPVTLTYIKMRLSERHVDCVCFENEAEAFEALRSEHFDAIVLDVHLRNRNALDLMPHIRSVSSAPVLFVTADESEQTRERVGQIKDALFFLKSDLNKLTEFLEVAV